MPTTNREEEETILAMAYTVDFFAATDPSQPYPQDKAGLTNKAMVDYEVYYDTDDDVLSDDGVDMTSTTSKSMELSAFPDPNPNWRPLPDPSLDDYESEDEFDSDDEAEMTSTLSTRSMIQPSSADRRPIPVHNMNEPHGSLFLSTSQLSSQRAKDNEVESERFLNNCNNQCGLDCSRLTEREALEFDAEQHEAPIWSFHFSYHTQ